MLNIHRIKTASPVGSTPNHSQIFVPGHKNNFAISVSPIIGISDAELIALLNAHFKCYFISMQLDKFTDYGLRILVTLATRSDARTPTTAIAKTFALSEHHLSKVASELVRNGFVISERGRHGGLTLARAAQNINLGAVVRSLQNDKPVVPCFGPDKSCLILASCGLRSPLAAAQEAFFATLDQYTLADVTTQKSALAALLSDMPPPSKKKRGGIKPPAL